MLAGSLLIYLLADLRDMVRAGEITGKTLLEPPMTTEQIMQQIQENKDALKARAMDHEDLQKRLDALQSLKEEGIFQSMFGSKQNTIMTHFVDTNAQEEMVHAIVVNEGRKRITVMFRGSVTQKDFVQDAKCAQKKIDMPIAALRDDVDGIRIHTGFHGYLFHFNKETGMTRLEEIMVDVKKSLEIYRGYDLYTCGHSLGGALCTLFGFFAAADDEICSLLQGSPVIVYSIASPYVGNWKFRFAFQHLERQRRLQHLRIANLEDMVTLLPFAAPKLSALSPALSIVKGAGNLYKHTGIRLQMTRQHICTISYPKDQDASTDEEYAKEVQDAMRSGKSLAQAFYYLLRQDFDRIVLYHSCEEYESRLEKCKSELMKVTLDELYADKNIVGDILDSDYEPKKMASGFARAKRTLWHVGGSKKSSKSLLGK